MFAADGTVAISGRDTFQPNRETPDSRPRGQKSEYPDKTRRRYSGPSPKSHERSQSFPSSLSCAGGESNSSHCVSKYVQLARFSPDIPTVKHVWEHYSWIYAWGSKLVESLLFVVFYDNSRLYTIDRFSMSYYYLLFASLCYFIVYFVLCPFCILVCNVHRLLNHNSVTIIHPNCNHNDRSEHAIDSHYKEYDLDNSNVNTFSMDSLKVLISKHNLSCYMTYIQQTCVRIKTTCSTMKLLLFVLIFTFVFNMQLKVQ